MSCNNIYVTRTSMPPMEEYFKEIEKLWDTHVLTNMGVIHNKLEDELKEYLGVSNLSLFTNGHMALELALQAFELEGEVITTPFTFASTTHAIVRNGLEPVFCDINIEDYTIDVNKIENLITDKTCAILPVHVYGNICNVEEINRLAKKYNLKVIYDAAHAFAVKKDGIGIGSFGDASMFSFHATKVYNTIEGGAVCYKNERIGKKLYGLKNFGIRSEELIDQVGANAKMNEFQAAMGICNLRYIESEIAKRKRIVEGYAERLSGIKGVVLPAVRKDIVSNYAYYPVLIDKTILNFTRDDVCRKLAEHGIFARKYFYPLTNAFKCYEQYYQRENTPIAAWVAENILTLPLYADLENNQVDLICSLIKSLTY